MVLLRAFVLLNCRIIHKALTGNDGRKKYGAKWGDLCADENSEDKRNIYARVDSDSAS